MSDIIPPMVGHDDKFFWDGVAEGVLLVRACASCGKQQHPPSPMCPVCGSVEWVTSELSGRGTVMSWIVSRHPTKPDDNPRIVVLVQLDEGPRLVSNLCDVDPRDPGVLNDIRVEVTFVDFDEVRLPQFRPIGEVA